MSDETGTPTETAPAPETEAAPEATPETAEKLFSQADIDKIKADFDSKVSKGINKGVATRERELKDEQETAQLRANDDHKALAQKQEKEIKVLKENAQRAAYIQDNDLSKYAAAFESVPIAKLPEVAKTIEDTVNAAVLAGISAKLETPAPPEGAPPTPGEYKDLSPDAWKEKKKTLNIH